MSQVAKTYGNHGFAGSLNLTFEGSAGQSFGVFTVGGMHLKVNSIYKFPPEVLTYFPSIVLYVFVITLFTVYYAGSIKLVLIV